jgi:adenylate cyclase
MIEHDKLQDTISTLYNDLQTLQVTLAHASVNMISPSGMDELNQIVERLGNLKSQAARLEANRQHLKGISAIGQLINASLDPGVVLLNVIDTIIKLTHAERGFLMLNDGKGHFVTPVARNWDQSTISEAELQVSRSVIHRVLSEGKPILTTNAQLDPRFVGQQSIITNKLRSILCVPLKLKDQIVGVVYTDHRIQTGIFSESDSELMLSFANQAAIAIENARLYASVKVSLDEVTELKKLMTDVFASIASGVITTNQDEEIIFCNQAARKILNVSEGGNLRKQLESHLPELAGKLSPYMERTWKYQESFSGLEFSPHTKSREELDLRFSLTPLEGGETKSKGITIVVEDQTEKKRLVAKQRLFERMVGSAVINQLNPDSIQLGGSRAMITTIFADLNGFTRLGENVSPETLISVINCYLSAAADAILMREGTIDKFLGDAVMAWFNAPIEQPDHALRAVKAAIAMRDILPEIQCQFPPEFQLDFSIGIDTGESVLGLVGTEKRLEFTAMGDSVNTAKRLQEYAQAGQIVISAATWNIVKDQVEVRKLDPFSAKGKTGLLSIYEVIKLKDGN